MSRKFALIIGNSQYEDSNLSQLVTPEADVNALAETLRSPQVGGFDEVITLVNQPATAVRRAIAGFFAARGRDDLLLLYFSGHGVRDDRGQLFLAVKDTEHKLLRGTAIPAAYITEEMDNSRSRRQVLVLDCCHSGAFARGMKGAPGSSAGTATAFEGTGAGRVVLTATDSTQYAWEGDQVIGQADNSVFTRYLIQGMRTGAADSDADGQITLDELYDYVYEQVVQETPKQTPSKWSYGQQGELVIARNPNPVVKPAALPPDLQQSIDDPRPWVREGAVQELDRILQSGSPGLAEAARQALQLLAGDDSHRVAQAAAKSLTATELPGAIERLDAEQLPPAESSTLRALSPAIPVPGTAEPAHAAETGQARAEALDAQEMTPEAIPAAEGKSAAGESAVQTRLATDVAANPWQQRRKSAALPLWALAAVLVLVGGAIGAILLSQRDPPGGAASPTATDQTPPTDLAAAVETPSTDQPTDQAVPASQAAPTNQAAPTDQAAQFPSASGLIAFASNRDGNDEIYVMNADGSGQTRLTNNDALDWWPTWSPDGRQLAFVSERDGNKEIYVMNADGSEQIRLTDNFDEDEDPAWSPDGKRIAFASYRDGNAEIYVMNADGSEQTRLTDNADIDWWPAWSPDSSQIAFFSERDDNFDIYVMNADGSEQTRLTDDPASDETPAWSPDGTKIVFVSERDGNKEIYGMNADGSDQARLSDNSTLDWVPGWSPDSQWIAFASDRDGDNEIYIMKTDSSDFTQLTDNDASDLFPDWVR